MSKKKVFCNNQYFNNFHEQFYNINDIMFARFTIKNKNLSNVKFNNVDFYDVKFNNVDFKHAKFNNVNFYNTAFNDVDFSCTEFDNAKFIDNVKLKNTKFRNAIFYKANFDKKVTFGNSNFDNALFHIEVEIPSKINDETIAENDKKLDSQRIKYFNVLRLYQQFATAYKHVPFKVNEFDKKSTKIRAKLHKIEIKRAKGANKVKEFLLLIGLELFNWMTDSILRILSLIGGIIIAFFFIYVLGFVYSKIGISLFWAFSSFINFDHSNKGWVEIPMLIESYLGYFMLAILIAALLKRLFK